jgi:SAM-dependent methyltransferase
MTAGHSRVAAHTDAAEPDPQAQEVLGLFEAKAAGWAAKYAPDGPLADRLANLSAAVHRCARVGSRVLDLGCGTGELARALAAAGLQVTGCDVSPQMLGHAARNRGGCAGWVRLEPDWRTLPFASAAFVVVVASSVLEYVGEPALILRECARVLRPGGVVLYSVPDLRHPVRWAEWLAQRLVGVMRAPSAGSRRSRWHAYHAYLRTSRQRHRARWWLAVSGMADLRPVSCPADGGQPTLRLMAFCRADERADKPLASIDDGSGTAVTVAVTVNAAGGKVGAAATLIRSARRRRQSGGLYGQGAGVGRCGIARGRRSRARRH